MFIGPMIKATLYGVVLKISDLGGQALELGLGALMFEKRRPGPAKHPGKLGPPCPGSRKRQAIGFAFSAKKAETSRWDDGSTVARPKPSAQTDAERGRNMHQPVTVLESPLDSARAASSETAGMQDCRWQSANRRHCRPELVRRCDRSHGRRRPGTSLRSRIRAEG
jgi:hypothetical protein